MKYLLLIFLMPFGSNLHAQSLDGQEQHKEHFIPIIKSGQTWIGQKGQAGPPESFQYTYAKDSILHNSEFYFQRIQSDNQDGSDPYVEGIYRERTGKLYRNIGGNYDKVVFDMSLEIGDVIKDTVDNLIVVMVDTVMYADNIPRKRIKLSCIESEEDPLFWVEGIGPLTDGTFCAIDGDDIPLRCVYNKEGDKLYASINQDEKCWLRTSSLDSIVSIENHEWVYEEEEYFGGGNSQIGFISSSTPAYIYSNGSVVYGDTISPTAYIEDSKMYFWDEHYQDYIMYYDWQETQSYEIPYYDQFTDAEEIATVIIDSITQRYFGDDSLQVQHVRILNSGTLEEYSDEVYEGVGAGYFGTKFLLGCGLCDFNPYTTKLRCFTNDTMTYQFVPYACDSTWLISSINNVNKEHVQLYPNPTTDKMHIKGIDTDVEYELFTSDGQLVKKGITANKMITLDSSGLCLLKLKVDQNWILKKIVRIE